MIWLVNGKPLPPRTTHVSIPYGPPAVRSLLGARWGLSSLQGDMSNWLVSCTRRSDKEGVKILFISLCSALNDGSFTCSIASYFFINVTFAIHSTVSTSSAMPFRSSFFNYRQENIATPGSILSKSTFWLVGNTATILTLGCVTFFPFQHVITCPSFWRDLGYRSINWQITYVRRTHLYLILIWWSVICMDLISNLLFEVLI